VCVCVSFVMCLSFGNMCTCIYCVLYCFVYVYVFLLVLSVLPPSDNSIAVSINNNNNNNNILYNAVKLLILYDHCHVT
jgi:hypothetical protein